MKKYLPRVLAETGSTNPSFKIAAIISIALFGLGVLSSYIVSDGANKQYINERNDAASQQLSSLANHILVKTAVYQQSLGAADGILTADGLQDMDQTKWNTFVDSLNLQTYSPEVRGMGFAANVTASQAATYEQQRRNVGFSNYTITPVGNRDLYSVVTYSRTYGAGQAPAYGYDLFSDPTRRAAMERARDTGEMAMTAPVLLKQDQTSKDSASLQGVILYYPVYAADSTPTSIQERRSSIIGYVYSAYRITDMLQVVTSPGSTSNYTLWDTSDSKPVLLSGASDAKATQKAYSQQLKLAGRTWQADVRLGSSTYQRLLRPLLYFGGGLLISLCISALAFAFLLRRFQNVQSGHEEELQKTKDELLALASHQLRTPATSVRQYISILLQGYFGKLNKKQLEITKKAYAANERQLEVIDQVLYVAKADSGQLMLSPELLNLQTFTRSIAEDFADQAAEKDISLVFSSSNRPVLCRADKRYVQMMVENLVSNAVKYSYPRSTITLRVFATSSYAQVSVADSGVGIAKEDMPKLFQKFSRIQNPLSQKEGGSGLGLFLAYKLAQAHRGKIIAISVPKRGSTFTLRLPLRGASAKSVIQLTE